MRRTPACHGIAAGVLLLVYGVLAASMTGCATSRTSQSIPSFDASVGRSGQTADVSPIVAYLGGEPLRRDTLWPALVEAVGRAVFDEFVIDAALHNRLDQRGLTLTATQIADELQALSDALSDDPNEAARLLAELRERRGLGNERFDRLLRRNAGLRMLIADDAKLAPQQLEAQARRAFAREFGPAFRVRLLTTDTATKAQTFRRRALAGEPVATLAAEYSTDTSRDRGGLLSPISPADATYPQVLRNTLPKLDADIDAGLSPVLALNGSYAFVQLIETIPGQDVDYNDVKPRLLYEVRRGNQRLLMEQLAGALRDEADVLVIDRDLGRVVAE